MKDVPRRMPLLAGALVLQSFGLFTAAAPGVVPDLGLGDAAAKYPAVTYHSSPAKHAKLEVKKSGGKLAAGHLFLSPQTKGATPLIATGDGDLIWAGDERGNDFRLQKLKGKDILTYYNPQAYSGLGWFYGAITILDNTYTKTHYICPDLGLYVPKFKLTPTTPKCQADIHEAEVTDDGTLLVTAYNVTRHDLSSVNGPKNGWVVDGQVHEIDIATGKKIFQWSSLKHIPLTASHAPAIFAGKKDTLPYDYFHINAIQKIGNRYLIGSRQTWAMYLIDSDGKLIWTFNGQDGGDFSLPTSPTSPTPLTHQWSWEHNARVEKVEGDTFVVTLFNNNNRLTKIPTGASTGFKYSLNTKTMKATLLRDLRDPDKKAFSDAEGSYQALKGGNGLVAFGNYPFIQEYGPTDDTDVRMTMTYGPGPADAGATYRAYKYVFKGHPKTVPKVAFAKGVGYVSWNGATDVTNYVIHAGTSKVNLKKASTVTRKGFETSFKVPKGTKFVRLDAHNGKKLLAKSLVTKLV